MPFDQMLTALGAITAAAGGIGGIWLTMSKQKAEARASLKRIKIEEKNSDIESMKEVMSIFQTSLTSLSNELERSSQRYDQHSQRLVNQETQIVVLRDEVRQLSRQKTSSLKHIARVEDFNDEYWGEGERPEKYPQVPKILSEDVARIREELRDCE